MPWEPTTPGTLSVAKPTDMGFTHITLNALFMKFDLDADGIVSEIVWREGHLVAGVFEALRERRTKVPTGPTMAWLTATNTAAEKNFVKLETAMFNYLLTIGEITTGTVVELP